MKKIIIAHTKGGVGKSTIAYNLAVGFWLEGKKIRSLDLDYQRTLFFVDKLRVSDVLAPAASLDVRIVSTPAAFAEAVELAQSEGVEYLFVDVGGFDSATNRAAIEAADMIVCPIRDNVQEVLGFHAFARVLEAVGSPVVHLLINGAHPRAVVGEFDGLFFECQKAYKNLAKLKSIVRYRAAFARAMSRGRGVIEKEKEATFGKAAEEIRALCVEIEGIL